MEFLKVLTQGFEEKEYEDSEYIDDVRALVIAEEF